MLAKLPHALNERPSTSPLTKPQMIRRKSVWTVSILSRKCLVRVAWGESFSEMVAWLPERDTVVLPPTDHIPPGYLGSSSSRDKDGCGAWESSQYIIWLLLALVTGGDSRGDCGCCMAVACRGRISKIMVYKNPKVVFTNYYKSRLSRSQWCQSASSLKGQSAGNC